VISYRVCCSRGIDSKTKSFTLQRSGAMDVTWFPRISDAITTSSQNNVCQLRNQPGQVLLRFQPLQPVRLERRLRNLYSWRSRRSCGTGLSSQQFCRTRYTNSATVQRLTVRVYKRDLTGICF
jgi:hypothetical protein